jgi:hypothetical protein
MEYNVDRSSNKIKIMKSPSSTSAVPEQFVNDPESSTSFQEIPNKLQINQV